MKKIMAVLVLVAAFAAPAAAQNVRWEKTVFPGNCTKQFHVTTASYSGYSNLVLKYGSDYVRKFSAVADLDTIEGLISTGDVACVLFYPGTFAMTDAWSIAKPVQIMSASGNPDDVNLEGTTNDVDVLIFADGSDGSSVRNIRITLDDATSAEEDGITVNSGADGVLIDNVTFTGSSTASTDSNAVVIAANRCRVQNCTFMDAGITGGIVVTGNDTIIRNNIFTGTKAAQVGIDINSANTASAGLRAVVENNKIAFTAASSDIGIKTASNALNNVYSENKIYAADPINSGTDNTTLHLFGNITSNVTTAAWITN